jgi:predicted enzyme related to lactoylglutathione lyase
MFTREGAPVAGGMGDMGDMRADDKWKIYLNTPDVKELVQRGEAAGAQFIFPPEPVADMGVQTVLMDPTGATLGAWEPGTFAGFSVLEEHGAPSWFELYTRDHARAVDFYQQAFSLNAVAMSESNDFRYSTFTDAEGALLAGVMDASSFLPEDVPAHWITYWEVNDIVQSCVRVKELGGSVIDDVTDSPYGRIATVADPTGARFKLRTRAS